MMIGLGLLTHHFLRGTYKKVMWLINFFELSKHFSKKYVALSIKN
jgi:hypothetical protein